jgi:hypothetical protein
MTGFATTIEFRTEHSFATAPRSGADVGLRSSNDPDRITIQRRVEAGLDRLLRDIEKFEEVERWDGMA